MAAEASQDAPPDAPQLQLQPHTHTYRCITRYLKPKHDDRFPLQTSNIPPQHQQEQCSTVFVLLPKQSRSGVTSASYYQLDLQVCTEQELMKKEQSEHELLLSGPEGDKVST